jgi:hypothetical protein
MMFGYVIYSLAGYLLLWGTNSEIADPVSQDVFV